MSVLTDNLRPASFRGVPFQVDDGDMAAGRRVQVHEYPQRDKPYVEDLGRATREMRVRAFVVGEDYLEQAGALLAALEEAGPGTLVHPWLGSLNVTVKDARVAYRKDALGVAQFELEFVEAGELTFPSAADSTQAQSRLAADDLDQAAQDDFAQSFTCDGYPDFVAESAIGDLTSIITGIGDARIAALDGLEYAADAVQAVTDVVTLINDPVAIAARLSKYLGISAVASIIGNGRALVRGLLAMIQLPALVAEEVAAQFTTASRYQAQRNSAAVRSLTRRLLLAQAVGASSLIDAQVYEDTTSLRSQLTIALDDEALTASDSVYAALTDARTRVWRDLTERSRDSARLLTITPSEPLPALVLAYDRYEDVTRDAEIVARNQVRHPGFVPAQAIQVLSR